MIRVPFTRWYLRRDRRHTQSGITIVVQPGVFHPGLFPSTRMLINYLASRGMVGCRLLELGCGSGLIAIIAERAGAVVTASDVSPAAIENTKINAASNRSQIRIISSDLFDQIPPQVFDCIVINPPYYNRQAGNDAEKAWYCGANFEYFWKLFPRLGEFAARDADILMTLAKEANISTIKSIAMKHGITFHMLARRSSLVDGTDYLFRLTAR